MDIIRGREVWKIVSSKLRPSVQEPIAQVSVDFASPKVMGSRRRHIPFRMLFLPSNRSICFLKKGLLQKMGYHLSKCFFVVVKFATVICPAVLSRQGLTVICIFQKCFSAKNKCQRIVWWLALFFAVRTKRIHIHRYVSPSGAKR